MNLGFVFGVLVCLVLAFLLAATESALSRVSRTSVAELADEGRRGAASLQTVLSDSAGYLSVLTFVRVVLETTAAVLVTVLVADLLDRVWHVILVAIAVMAVASFVLVGVSPRTLGRQHALGIALAGAGPVVWLRALLGPLARLLVAAGNVVTPGRGYRDGPFESEADLRELVDLAGESLVIEAGEREMIHSVFELGDTVTREVMVPRTDTIWIPVDATLRQGMSLFVRSGFSRVPVIGEDADDPVGLLYFKDVAEALHHDPSDPAAAEMPLTGLMRPVPFVPESKPVDALLREMQRDQTHMAVVIDEYGGTAGIVTIEDLIEEIVGEISDEHDREAPGVEELDDGRVRVPASMHVDDFAEMFDLDLEEDDVDTVGGLLGKLVGRVPIIGSSARIDHVVLVADRLAGRRRRVASVVVERVETPEDDTEDERSHRRGRGSHAARIDEQAGPQTGSRAADVAETTEGRRR